MPFPHARMAVSLLFNITNQPQGLTPTVLKNAKFPRKTFSVVIHLTITDSQLRQTSREIQHHLQEICSAKNPCPVNARNQHLLQLSYVRLLLLNGTLPFGADSLPEHLLCQLNRLRDDRAMIIWSDPKYSLRLLKNYLCSLIQKKIKKF